MSEVMNSKPRKTLLWKGSFPAINKIKKVNNLDDVVNLFLLDNRLNNFFKNLYSEKANRWEKGLSSDEAIFICDLNYKVINTKLPVSLCFYYNSKLDLCISEEANLLSPYDLKPPVFTNSFPYESREGFSFIDIPSKSSFVSAVYKSLERLNTKIIRIEPKPVNLT